MNSSSVGYSNRIKTRKLNQKSLHKDTFIINTFKKIHHLFKSLFWIASIWPIVLRIFSSWHYCTVFSLVLHRAFTKMYSTFSIFIIENIISLVLTYCTIIYYLQLWLQTSAINLKIIVVLNCYHQVIIHHIIVPTILSIFICTVDLFVLYTKKKFSDAIRLRRYEINL